MSLKPGPISMNFSSLSSTDFYLAIFTSVFGFFVLLLLLVLKNSSFEIWVTRKIMHFIGGTYIAFIVFYFESIIGIILAIIFFLIIFLSFLFFSKFKVLKEYFVLKNCRSDERDYTFIINTATTLIVLFILLIIFNDYPPIFTVGTLTIAWGDTSGEVIGRNYPFIKYKIFSQKTLTGSLAVFAFSILSILVSVFYYQLPFNINWLWKIVIGGIACAIVEAASWKWFDNILLPICGSLVMFWLTFSV